MAELTAVHMIEQGVTALNLVNRSLERASTMRDRLRERVTVDIFRWSELREQVHAADIVISSTAADQPVITTDMLINGDASRRYSLIWRCLATSNQVLAVSLNVMCSMSTISMMWSKQIRRCVAMKLTMPDV